MAELFIIGFIAGLIAGISPCILPVLPVILVSGSASHDTGARALTRRSIATIAGLVVSFSVFTLVGSELLSALGLPQDFLRDAGLILLALIGASLIIPQLGALLERPFARFRVAGPRQRTSGFALGVGLGAVYVPCAGPVLAAIAVAGATHRIGTDAILLTLAFVLGTAVPLLAVALAGDSIVERSKSLAGQAYVLREIGGVVILVMTALIGFGALNGLQRAVPGYTNALQQRVEGSVTAREQLQSVPSSTGSNGALMDCIPDDPVLERCGDAPPFTGIVSWLNTSSDRPVALSALRGKVVLVDFWTYSCINCQRSLPHVEAWYSRYHDLGLDVIGIHTPEFAFEHVLSNVKAAAAQLGVHYPIALDNNYSTWVAYENNYWPAEYLIDARGVVRYISYGEGAYSSTETLIRELLVQANPQVVLPARTGVANKTPTEQTTPETYLGYWHLSQSDAPEVSENQSHHYVLAPSLPSGELAYGGTWTVNSEESTAGNDAVIALNFSARDVYLVLGGKGTLTVALRGTTTKTIDVSGVPRLYTLVSGSTLSTGVLSLHVSSGVEAYDFTFG